MTVEEETIAAYSSSEWAEWIVVRRRNRYILIHQHRDMGTGGDPFVYITKETALGIKSARGAKRAMREHLALDGPIHYAD